MANTFEKVVNKINKTPLKLRQFLLTKLFCTKVKYAGTSKVTLLEVSTSKAVLTIKNRRRVRNHIGGVHAVAAALLAESASGIVVGMNTPDSKIPLLKSMTMHYKRRMQGGLTAVATLDESQKTLIHHQDKGETMVNVVITDESGEQPIECEMLWAWVSKKR